jgi:hypothetical protein
MQHLIVALRGASHLLSPDVINFVQGDDFAMAVLNVDDHNEARAQLMIAALKEFALCPLTGDHPDDFSETWGDSWFFNIRFDRIVNFIGIFSLPAESELAHQVVKAIEENLAGRMYKAAAMHRRLDVLRKRICAKTEKRASQAYQSVIAKYGKDYNRIEIREEAKQAFDQVFDSAMAHVDARIRKVAVHSARSYGQSYSQIVGDFLFRHMNQDRGGNALQFT